ncbi:unnamed protein product [Rotaria socialis]|uniref:Uncharacterized protein n=1 Tax=Rotaria socialis TaxID=392032 RepID=A0A820X5E4_9BILA|nr:unnamed protein product [Rotaria socialis]CAF4526987.1 unnamed protein product [Rotaria socialis]
MESSRDGYRGRYRDRHNNFSTNRNNYTERSTSRNSRGRFSRGSENDHNGNFSSRGSENENFNYRTSRSSVNSRPISSRNGLPKHNRYQQDDDFQAPSHFSSSSSSSNRANNVQTNYYDNHSPPSRFGRPSNHCDTYRSSANEHLVLSNVSLPPTSLYYASSQSMSPRLRDRGSSSVPLSSQHIDSDRSRYIPTNYRRNSPPPPVASYRNERSMDYGSRNINNDIYMSNECRSATPPSLAPLSMRDDPYGEMYRANDYPPRSDRYDIPSNRNNTSSRDYPMVPVSSSSYRNDLYRSSSNVSMSSPSSSSSYIPREQYVQDFNYRPMSQPRDYGTTSSSSSRTNYSSLMDPQESSFRNPRDHGNRSSHRDRPILKRSGSRYDDDDGPIPSKRPMRR